MELVNAAQLVSKNRELTKRVDELEGILASLELDLDDNSQELSKLQAEVKKSIDSLNQILDVTKPSVSSTDVMMAVSNLQGYVLFHLSEDEEDES